MPAMQAKKRVERPVAWSTYCAGAIDRVVNEAAVREPEWP